MEERHHLLPVPNPNSVSVSNLSPEQSPKKKVLTLPKLSLNRIMSLPTRTLGKNGPQVIASGLGLMSLGHAYGHAGSDEDRFAFLDKAYELGETTWDCADIYGDAEDVTGKWFKRTGKRSEIFLATKFAYVDMANPTNLRSDPEYVFQAIEKSLKRLQTDYIDLYYCHRVDGKTPIEKTVEAMAESKR